ncbi:galactose-specific lectin nattectin-like [Perca fluviatilis]|uniref:galactose-specific lectin nattectin-like n=1 Tax=Perca fluviatilis TaxID=8168 RepID=UPI001962B3CF|nr:galactose-specific lectin nattectin-like [Perca fluviatilis]
MTWAKAERNCQSLGGNLASVHNIFEYREIQRIMATTLSIEYKEAWLGGSDAQEDGVWLWSDSSLFSYQNWCPGQPDNTHQHCLQMNFGDKFTEFLLKVQSKLLQAKSLFFSCNGQF